MEAQFEDPVEEIKRLRSCVSDLVSVLALPAIWSGGEPSHVVSTLLDALLGMLRLDFVYLRLNSLLDEMPFEMVRSAQSLNLTGQPEEICDLLNNFVGYDSKNWPPFVRHRVGDEDISIVSSLIGLQGDIGVLVAGSKRADFPGQTERLVLSVAANQAATGLQEARLLGEQRRLATELDRRVALRTKELAESNEELRLQVGLLQHIPVVAWTFKSDGVPDFVNQGWLDYTGQTLEFIQSNPEAWMDAIHPYDREEASTAFWDGIRSGEGFTMETRFRRAHDGEYRWHLNRAVALSDTEGNIVRFVGTSTDISDLKQFQEELRKTQAELAHVTRVMTMGQLTASIAHEVNQPLSGIMTNAGTCLRMLDSDPPNIDGARETARRTIRDGNRASDVITRLRDLFRKNDTAAESVDLNDAAREVIALSLNELQSNNIVVQQELAEDLPEVTGDRIQIQQVILNLLRNASDAMRDVHDRPRQLLIKTERDNSKSVQLTVRDSGIGFAPNAANRIFESFYTTKDDGMGIGLSISRSIIEAHRGRLWASANDGPGCSFAFSIPNDR